MDENIEFFQCDCGSEILSVEAYDEEDILLAMYELYPTKKRFSFLYRLRLAWYVFRRGTFYNDQIVLSRNKIVKLITHLQNLIGEEK